ncbi:hypothetical protein ES705_10172 [subsurface metagenome]|jgi:hypothetical protein
MISLEKALDKAKEVIINMKGLDTEFYGKPMIDWLDFETVKKRETEKSYILKSTFRANMFNTDKVSFEIHINKETGELDDFKRLED